jgi:hypothetical protein
LPKYQSDIDPQALVRNLRQAVELFDREADSLRKQIDGIQATAALLGEQLVRVETTRASTLASIDTLESISGSAQAALEPEPEATADPDSPEPKSTAGASSAPPPRRGPIKPTAAQLRHRQLLDSIVQILATADKPLKTREVTELLGNTPSRSTVESTRKLLKEVTESGEAVEVAMGVYEIASPSARRRKAAA